MLDEDVVKVNVGAVFRPRRVNDIATLGDPFGPLLGAKLVEHKGAEIARKRPQVTAIRREPGTEEADRARKS